MTAPRQLLGLTFHRPWPVLIGLGIKKIENRRWEPGPRLLPGEWFAVHVGKKYDDRCSPMAQKLGVDLDVFFNFSSQLGEPGHIVAVVRFARVVTESADPWFFGPFGWELDAVVQLPPIPCKGAQGLWAVPADIADRCRAAYRAHAKVQAGPPPAQP